MIVCDNASGDGSLDHIERWADGQLLASACSTDIIGCSAPPVEKPVRTVRLRQAEAEAGVSRYDAPLVLIEAEENRGFAAGCNIGVRFALTDQTIEFIWLLTMTRW